MLIISLCIIGLFILKRCSCFAALVDHLILLLNTYVVGLLVSIISILKEVLFLQFSCDQFTKLQFRSVRSSLPAIYMVDIDVQIPSAFDPFAEAKDSGAPGAKEYVHIRIQQRNGKKSLTTVQGLRKEFSYEKILKDLKKEFCCNGNVVQDKELGKVIQLQGDQRKNVSHFLVTAGVVKKDQIKIHGF